MSGTRTFLELTDPTRFHPSWTSVADVHVNRVSGCPPSFFRYLYETVGRPYGWVDRLAWTDDEIARHLADPAVSLWVMTVTNAPAGYFELREEGGRSIELAYFGLLPEFTGRGLGAHLLSVAVERAFELGAERVWLHTCTKDHPAALPNYLKRGFVPFGRGQI